MAFTTSFRQRRSLDFCAFFYWLFFFFLSDASDTTTALEPIKPFFKGFMVFLFLNALVSWHYLTLRHQRLSITLSTQHVLIAQGVWWQSETLLLRNRLQYVDLSQSPLERRFQLATLTLFTAGSALPAIRLSALGLEQAQSIRAALSGDRDMAYFNTQSDTKA